MQTRRYRIGIDVGGTFTDFVLADLNQASLSFYKEPSVPADPSLAVERGLATLIEKRGIDPAEIELIVHGTTIGLNAIIQRRGARIALITSTGNRDVLEIARLRLPSSYDFTEPREQPLVPRDLVFETSARMRSDGSIEVPINDEEVDALAEKLRAADVSAVAIMLLNSYRSSTLEVDLGERLRAHLPDMLVTESAEIWPEVREYERCLIGALNGYIQPLKSQYFDSLARRVKELGVAAPIYITANNGGTLSLDTARARPINTILSGPAAGVVASLAVGKAAGTGKLITFDMGGTSADISVCREGRLEFTTTTHVGDFPLIMPVVNVSAIGAGGGSSLWLDDQGLLKVGPVSAGADPGPVCYGRGGQIPTVTDCYVALGIVDPTSFLGGRMTLDRDAALAALKPIADAMGMTGADASVSAAEAGIRVASAKMATEIFKLLAEAGVDPREFSLVAYGGAGPTHANYLAEEAGLTSVLVPTAPGTFCALGAVLADIRRDYVRTARLMISNDGGPGWTKVEEVLTNLEAEAVDWIANEGELVGEHGFVASFNIRYPGQAYEIEIVLDEETRKTLTPRKLLDLFHKEHERLYGFAEPDSPVQTSTIRLAVIGRVARVQLPDVASNRPEPVADRRVWHKGAWLDAPVFNRGDIGEGAVINGPAVIDQPDTTVLLLPGWTATTDRLGTLRLTRTQS
jgi:N-methylhydantoinase A